MKKIPDDLKDMNEVKQLRIGELSKMFSPHFGSIKNYQIYIMNLIKFLGTQKPEDDRDRTIRNLIADCNDMLEFISSSLKEGKYNVASTLTRRLFENTSLANSFILNIELHNRWHSGEEIQNKEVRRELDKSELGADIESTRSIYYSLSDMSHPSRVAIMDRLLGEGVEFSLDGYPTPSVYYIAETLTKCLSLVFWLCAVVSFFYKNLILSHNPKLIDLYKFTSEHAQKINDQLYKELDRLLSEENIILIEPKGRAGKPKKQTV